MRTRFRSWGKFVIALVVPALLLLALPVSAQQQTAPPPAQTPPKTDSTTPGSDGQKDSKDAPPLNVPPDWVSKNDRIFGVIPNHNTVDGATQISPITPGEKFKLAFSSLLDPYTYGIVSVLALEAQAAGDPSSWGGGMKGFGRRYAASLTDQTIGPLMTTGFFPTILHQDPRYFRLGKGGFKRRFKYSMERLVVTRTDSGHAQFNYSEFIGNAAATGLSNLYYPAEERTVSGNLGQFATQVGVDALGNFLKEFWPDMKHKLHKGKSD